MPAVGFEHRVEVVFLPEAASAGGFAAFLKLAQESCENSQGMQEQVEFPVLGECVCQCVCECLRLISPEL